MKLFVYIQGTTDTGQDRDEDFTVDVFSGPDAVYHAILIIADRVKFSGYVNVNIDIAEEYTDDVSSH